MIDKQQLRQLSMDEIWVLIDNEIGVLLDMEEGTSICESEMEERIRKTTFYANELRRREDMELVDVDRIVQEFWEDFKSYDN